LLEQMHAIQGTVARLDVAHGQKKNFLACRLISMTGNFANSSAWDRLFSSKLFFVAIVTFHSGITSRKLSITCLWLNESQAISGTFSDQAIFPFGAGSHGNRSEILTSGLGRPVAPLSSVSTSAHRPEPTRTLSWAAFPASSARQTVPEAPDTSATHRHSRPDR
jgi:hypothetical protein